MQFNYGSSASSTSHHDNTQGSKLMKNIDPYFALAAEWVINADGLLITAGAGMGVDSGLPDYRGEQGLWKAYPALGSQKIKFQEIANGMSFKDNPRLAWGFYGHRLQQYRVTVPHEGFHILLELSHRFEHGSFVYTSNVDGQFQRAGFPEERITECHGSLHYLQCEAACSTDIWPADSLAINVDEANCSWKGVLPKCHYCSNIARPNVLMFNDWSWLPHRTDAQYDRMTRWLEVVKRPVVIELGAGTAIPTVRRKGELLGAPLIRINLREFQVPSNNAVGIAMNALDATRLLKAHIDVLT
jgi:NAD-dependent SIR2 family protein deacetylase